MEVAELAPGLSFGEGGRYSLERLIGTGGMASVWRAKDSRLEREVAVKVLSDVLALDQDYVLRFEREARLAAGLSHPHLVNIFDFSVHGARPYLVMEYVAGGTLADRVGASPNPRWDSTAFAVELLGALAHIHKAGIIHRDIKPANVLIGSDGRARLTDFGIAKLSGATRITATGHVIGTARYIAPEILRGQSADERSDLYSCGVLLRGCLASGGTPQLRRLVEQLTQDDPRRRPASATDAISELERPAKAPTKTLLRTANAAATSRTLPTAASVARPRVTRHGRQIQVHLTRATALTATAAVVLLIGLIVLVSGGSGGGGTRGAGSVVLPPANAPLAQQLAGIDKAIGLARR